jgi:molybdate transport system ATP-binding protein
VTEFNTDKYDSRREWLVRLEGVTLRVRDRLLLEGTDWVIGSKQHWAVIGPNGAGKSTLVGALTGEVPIVRGKIHFNPTRLSPDRIARVSFAHQRRLAAQADRRDEARCFSRQHDFQTVRQALRPAPVSDLREAPEFGPIADRLELQGLADRPVRYLSNGEIRKVLIARALMGSPRLLILDEPFEGLDPANRRNLMDGFRQWIGDRTRLVLVTHRLDEISDVFTHILAVRDGRVVYRAERTAGMQPQRIEKLYGAGTVQSPDPPLTADGCRRRRRGAQTGPLVALKHVTVRFGHTAVLCGVNWTVNPGENWAVCGPNGCGKSTLLKLIFGELPQAYANEVRVFGRRRGRGESVWEIKSRIGYLSPEFQIRYRKPIVALEVVLSGFFDSVGLYHRYTVRQRAAAENWMARLGICRLARQNFLALSQGEQRQVLLARAMVKRPSLLMLDEPCHGLDPRARQVILQQVDQLGRRPETHLIYVSHHAQEAPACLTHLFRFRPNGDGSYAYECARIRSSRRF